METAVKQNSTGIAFKWAIIYVITNIVLTLAFQYLNVDPLSPVKYLVYIPFIAFLFLTQKEYRDTLSSFMTFGEGFLAGLYYSIFSGILLAVFIYIYLTFINPHMMEQTIAAQHDVLIAKGLTEEQVETTAGITRKFGSIIATMGVLIGTPIAGAIIALIGAAIFKKERSPLDADSYVDPAV